MGNKGSVFWQEMTTQQHVTVQHRDSKNSLKTHCLHDVLKQWEAKFMQKYSTQRYYLYFTQTTHFRKNHQNKTRKQTHKTPEQLPQKVLSLAACSWAAHNAALTDCAFWILNHQQNSCWSLDCFLSILQRQKQSSTWRTTSAILRWKSLQNKNKKNKI